MNLDTLNNAGNFPVEGLFKIADLIYFEGPLLSLFKSPDGGNYLFYWCDGDENVNRWLIFQVSHPDLMDYLQKRKTLHDLLVNNRAFSNIWAADVDGELRFRSVEPVSVNDLPDSQIPGKDSFYGFKPRFTNPDHEVLMLGYYQEKQN